MMVILVDTGVDGDAVHNTHTDKKKQPPTTPTHPQQVHGINNFVARYGHVGVYATHATRTRREIRGTSFTVQFTIVDTRPPVGQGGRRQVKVDTVRASGNAVIAGRGPYKVSVMLRVRIGGACGGEYEWVLYGWVVYGWVSTCGKPGCRKQGHMCVYPHKSTWSSLTVPNTIHIYTHTPNTYPTHTLNTRE